MGFQSHPECCSVLLTRANVNVNRVNGYKAWPVKGTTINTALLPSQCQFSRASGFPLWPCACPCLCLTTLRGKVSFPLKVNKSRIKDNFNQGLLPVNQTSLNISSDLPGCWSVNARSPGGCVGPCTPLRIWGFIQPHFFMEGGGWWWSLWGFYAHTCVQVLWSGVLSSQTERNSTFSISCQ